MTRKRDLKFYKDRATVSPADVTASGLTWSHAEALLDKYARPGRPSNVWVSPDTVGFSYNAPYAPDVTDVVDVLYFLSRVTGRDPWSLLDEAAGNTTEQDDPWPSIDEVIAYDDRRMRPTSAMARSICRDIWDKPHLAPIIVQGLIDELTQDRGRP